MFGLKFDKRGIYLLLLSILISVIINSILLLSFDKMIPFYISIFINFIVVYLFSMYYHKKLNVLFSKDEMKNISYTFQISIAVIMLVLIILLLPTLIAIVGSIIFLVINYFLIFLYLYLYNKINKSAS